MTESILQLAPQNVWTYFNKLTQIPRVSGHENAVSKYLSEEGIRLGLSSHTDKTLNVFIDKPASAGMENKPAILLQGHMDMVGAVRKGTVHDFLKDPIKPYITDNGFVTAGTTTLGADDGMGIALIMALLSDNTIKHPVLHAIFTISEETDMVGASALKSEDIKADIGINIDSEDLGEICIGCAGGASWDISITPEIQKFPNEYKAIKISVADGLGGHSGIDIDNKRLNAGKTLLGIISSLANEGIKPGLCSFESGTVRNAIPGYGEAIIAVEKNCLDKAVNSLKEVADKFTVMYVESDPKVKILIDTCAAPNIMIPFNDTKRIMQLRNLCVGVLERNPDKTPLTSISAGRYVLEDGTFTVSLLARFATESGGKLADETIKKVIKDSQADGKPCEEYGYWSPNYSSVMRKKAENTYQSIFGIPAKTTVIHAGLECGVLKKLNPNLDMISIGPDIYGAHTPDEKVRISSVEKCWQWLKAIIE